MTIIQEVQKKKKKKIEEKNKVLESAGKLFDARDDIIDLFEKGTFLYKGNVFKTRRIRRKQVGKIFFKYIEDESKGINYELFEKYFYFLAPTVLAKKLYEAKGKQ